ncbi:MAG: glycosyltransferase family A protein [Pseudomonadota bacterium]
MPTDQNGAPDAVLGCFLYRAAMGAVKVTAIVPVYGGEQTLAEALRSVLAQNLEGLEVIFLDDGSPDASWRIACEIEDDRLITVQHPNRGLAATLNRGIELARGRYIARQDQDDLVLATRLEKQFMFLEAHPDVAMVGTWAQIYSGDIPTQRYHRHPCSNEALQLELLFDNPFVHSSMMIRTDVLRTIGGYCEDKSRQPPEDYELWSRIARRHRIANFPEVLTVYREMPGSMSRAGENPFLNNVIHIASENLSHVLSPRYSLEECAALADIYHRGGAGNTHLSLSKARARQMLEFAAHALNGNRSDWPDEFLASYQRMRAHLDSRFLRRRIPTSLLGPTRWLRDRILRRKC